MKRLLLLAALIASSFVLTACETHVVDRRPAYYSDRPYYNRSRVVVHRGYDHGPHHSGYGRGYYGGSGYSGGHYSRSYHGGDRYSRSSSRTNYVVNAPRYTKKKVIINRNDDDDDDRRRSQVIRRRY